MSVQKYGKIHFEIQEFGFGDGIGFFADLE